MLPFPRKEHRPEYGRPDHPHEVTTLLAPSCARCGAPLPAVAADPTHPEWCGACAARALDTPGTLPPPVASSSGRASQAPWTNPTTATVPTTASSLVVKTRVLDGILTGLASAAIAGVVWWAIATTANLEQWHLGAAAVGLIVGQGVLTGSRKGGLVSGLLALVFSILTVVVAVYFIDRSQMIIGLADAGRTSDIPLWQGFSAAEDVYRGWWEFDKTRPAMWLLAPLIAVIIAGWPGRRPLIG